MWGRMQTRGEGWYGLGLDSVYVPESLLRLQGSEREAVCESQPVNSGESYGRYAAVGGNESAKHCVRIKSEHGARRWWK